MGSRISSKKFYVWDVRLISIVKYLATSETSVTTSEKKTEGSPDDMIQACFSMTFPGSPEYNNIDQSLELYFNTLHLMCNREVVAILIDFMNEIMRELR